MDSVDSLLLSHKRLKWKAVGGLKQAGHFEVVQQTCFYQETVSDSRGGERKGGLLIEP